MSQEVYDLPDEAATLSLGAELGHRLAAGGCVYLEGDLGAGKTTPGSRYAPWPGA